MKIIELKETDSTNVYLMQHAAEHEDMTVALASYQTAGRGMGSNVWESQPGKNLLFSILLHPAAVPPRWQYLLSMTEAIALRDSIAELVPNECVTIKWPNDIYCGDRKISGTRIDLNLFSQGIKDIVIGTGINVNQREFHSDAPNPVSLWQLTGREYDVNVILADIIARFEQLYSLLVKKEEGKPDVISEEGRADIIRMYHERLYRRHGLYEYNDKDGKFKAEIVEVQPDGILLLRRENGTVSRYEFKEVRFR